MSSETASSGPVRGGGIPQGLLFRGLALVAVLWLLSADYLSVYFSTDDLMNLYRSVGEGWGLLRGLVLFWSSRFNRPVGELLYLGIYSAFGLHPVPFKLALLLIESLNLLIAWRVASLVLRDARLGAVAVLLVAYHPSFPGDLIYNSGNFGTIYDVACFTFVYLGLWLWMEARKAGHFPGKWAVLGIAACQILALDSKEMAVALPVLLLLWELFGGGLVSRPQRNTRPRVEWRALPGICVCTLIVAVFLIGKSQGAGSLLNMGGYRPTFTLHVYLQNMSHYLNQVFESAGFFGSPQTTKFLCAGLVVAALLRARVMAFGWLWFLIGLLPVVFLPGRGGSVLYIPMVGLAVAAAGFLRRVFQLVGRVLGEDGRGLDPAAAPLFCLLLGFLVPTLWPIKQEADAASKQADRRLQNFARDLARAPAPPRRATLLYLRDPFDPNRYDPLFLSSLLRGDHDLRVGRAKANQFLLSPEALASYDAVYDYDNGHLSRIPRAETAAVLQNVRTISGSTDPAWGIRINTDTWWWTQPDFGLTAQCPDAAADCRLILYMDTPVPPFVRGETHTISIDRDNVHWRDIAVSPRGDPYEIEIPLVGGGHRNGVRFRVDRSVTPAQLGGNPQNLGILLSSVRIQ